MNWIEVIGLMVGTGGITAGLTAAITLYLGSRKATNDDARLGLDALVEGLEAARTTVDDLTTDLASARDQINAIERQAYAVLSENNLFRGVHGFPFTSSLVDFKPLTSEEMEKIKGGGQ